MFGLIITASSIFTACKYDLVLLRVRSNHQQAAYMPNKYLGRLFGQAGVRNASTVPMLL